MAGPPPKWIMKLITAVNVGVYRMSGGRLMKNFNGSPICLVTMIGRKTGQKRVIPLMYTPNGKDVLIVASLGGAPQHPVWYHNLVANPRVEIEVNGKTQTMDVRQASADEKKTLWPLCVASYPAFADYQKLTDRDIPVMVCSPAA